MPHNIRMPQLWSDLRISLRLLSKRPVVTAVALLSLALGIGANTAIFSLLNALILRPLPIPHPEQLVALSTSIFDDSANRDQPFTWPMVQELSRQQHFFSDIFCWESGAVSNFEVNGARYASSLTQVSGTFYQALQLPPLLGRYINSQDVALESGISSAVAVVSYRAWRAWFQASPHIIGQTIRIGNHPFTIIGVTPENFSDLSADSNSDVTIPVFAPGTFADRSRNLLRFHLFARLQPNLSLQQTHAGLQTLWPHILDATKPPDYAGERKARFFARKIKIQSAATGVSSLRLRFAYALKILMAIVGAVLFIACLNIASLSLAKAAANRHQAGIQSALGASTWHLLRPALVESLLLSFTGALLGLALAFWACRFLLRMTWNSYVATTLNPSPDWTVLLFTVLIATIAGLLFGSVPAFYSARIDPIDALKQQSRSVQSGAHLFGKILLVGQIALSLVLMLAALLFGRTLSSLHNTDVGYRRDHFLTLVLFPQAGTAEAANPSAYFQQVIDKVKTIPGILDASYSENGPASEFEYPSQTFGSLSQSPALATSEHIAPNFFSVAGMHLLAGRDFQWTDFDHNYAIVSQSLAHQLFANQDPIGRTIYRGSHARPDPFTVIGVVNSASLWKVESVHPMAVYQPFQPGPDENEPILDVHTSIDPQSLKTPIERAVQSLGHHYSLRTMTVEERLDSYITVQRLTAILSEFFGIVALLIACVGLYGLMSYHVSRRTTELGIRSALGARRSHLLTMVLGEAMLIAAVGCTLGLLTSLAAGRFVKNILFGVTPNDPISLTLTLLAMLTVAFAAAYLPARRAAQIDPMLALRSE